jgi:hypothetical protein
MVQILDCYLSRICAEHIIVLSTRRIGTMFGYNLDETDSKWTQVGKPAEYNPKQKL